MRRVLAVFLTVVAVLAPAVDARADRGTVSKYFPTRSVQFRDGDGDVLVVEKTLNLVAGDRRHLHARLEAVSSTKQIVAMNAVIKCFGTGLIGQSTTSRNHEGSDGPYAEPGHLPLYVDLLVSVETAGTYRCGLYAKTSGNVSGGYNLAVVTGGQSWLEISDSPQYGADRWENPVCGSTGSEPSCTFVGPSNKDSFVFYDDGTPKKKWTRAAGTSAVEALANVTVTTCYQGTSSCDGIPAGDQLPRPTGGSSKSVISFRLDVLQLDVAGSHTCKTTQSPVETNNITDNAHHYTAYLSIPNVAVDKTCGDTFMMRVYVKHISGSGIKIDGQQGATSLTNGIMMNLY